MQAMHLDTTVFEPLIGAPTVEVAVIWNRENTNPCIRTFAETAVEVWGKMQTG